MLRVRFPDAAGLGESVTVLGVGCRWWYRSSTGELLASYTDVDLAALRVMASLDRWVAAAGSSWRTGGT